MEVTKHHIGAIQYSVASFVLKFLFYHLKFSENLLENLLKTFLMITFPQTDFKLHAPIFLLIHVQYVFTVSPQFLYKFLRNSPLPKKILSYFPEIMYIFHTVSPEFTKFLRKLYEVATEIFQKFSRK